MKSTVERLSPTRVRINVEVPFDELKPDFDRAYKKIAQQVRVPGFRPGQGAGPHHRGPAGPRRGARGGRQRRRPGQVLARPSPRPTTLTPIGRPDIEVTEIADGDKLAFTAEVDVRPEITLPDLDVARGHGRRRRGRPTRTSTSSWTTCAPASAP